MYSTLLVGVLLCAISASAIDMGTVLAYHHYATDSHPVHLTLYAANSTAMCPTCHQLANAVHHLESRIMNDRTLSVGVVYCDLLPPGSTPCSDVSSLPQIRLTVAGEDDLAVQLQEGASVTSAKLLSWIIQSVQSHTDSFDLSHHESVLLRLELDDVPPVTLTSDRLLIKTETSKYLREIGASTAEEVLVVLHYTPECTACGSVLAELELLQRENKGVGGLRVIRSPVDTLVRSKYLFIDPSEDVPLISVLDRRSECTSQYPCRPVLFRGTGPIASFLQLQFGLKISSSLERESSISAQLRTLKGTRLSFGIAEVFTRQSESQAEQFMATCQASDDGCLFLVVSDWLVGRDDRLQQDINQYIGAAKMSKQSPTKFAIMDAANTHSALHILADVAEEDISGLCPNWVCVWHIKVSGVVMLPSYFVDASLIGKAINVKGHPSTATEQMLVKRADGILFVDGFKQHADDPRIVLPADDRLHPRSKKVLLLTLPPMVVGSLPFNQAVRRQASAFERLCRRMNATTEEGSVVCGVVDGTQFKSEVEKTLLLYAAATLNNPMTAAKASRSLIDALESLGDGAHSSSVLLYTYQDHAVILDLVYPGPPSSALTAQLLVDSRKAARHVAQSINVSSFTDTYIKHITASIFDQTLRDPQFANFVLFGGGPSCPHTQSLLPMLEKVAKVFDRDRREVAIVYIDASRELPRDMQASFELVSLPQLRFFPKGGYAEKRAHHKGDSFPGTPHYSAVLEYIHQRMGYPFLETDISTDRNATFEALTVSALSKQLSERSKPTAIFIFDSLARDRDDMKRLFATYSAHFKEHEQYGENFQFFRADGQRHKDVFKRLGLSRLTDTLPTLAFFPADQGLDKSVVFKSSVGRFDSIEVSKWLVEQLDSDPLEESFEFTIEEQRAHASIGRSLEGVQRLDGGAFPTFVQSDGDNVVLFYVTTCAHCQSFLKYFELAARHFRGTNVKFGTVELSGNSEIGHGQGVQKVPLVRVYFEGSSFKQDLRGEDYTGQIDTKEQLVTFIESNRGSSKVQHLDALREARDKSVLMLSNKSSFEKYVGSASVSKSKLKSYKDFTKKTADGAADFTISYDDNEYIPPTLVEFATPWCGHCHYMTKILLELERFVKIHMRFEEYAPYVKQFKPKSPLRVAKVDAIELTEVANKFSVEEYPTIILFYTRVLKNGTMRHCHSTYKGLRFTDRIGAFIKSNLAEVIEGASSLDSEPVKVTPIAPKTPTPDRFGSDIPSDGFEEDDSAPIEKLNSSIPVFAAKDIRMFTRRTALALVMTFDNDLDESHIMTWNEVWKVIAASTPFKRGFMTMGLFPSRKIHLVSNATGWINSTTPQIALFRGTATPHIVHFNSSTISILSNEEGLDVRADQPMPATVLKFLDKYVDKALTFPETLNTTNIMSRIAAVTNESDTLQTLAVLLVRPSCALCETMLSSTSYSAQSQMTAHLPAVEVTLLNVDSARSIYRQFGRPELPALLVFRKEDGMKDMTISLLTLPKNAEGAATVPSRKSVNKFILGDSENQGVPVFPAAGFYLDANKLMSEEVAPSSTPLVHYTEASDFLMQTRASAQASIVLVMGKSGSRTNEQILAMFRRVRDISSPKLGVTFSVLELPRNSRVTEKELSKAGFKAISQPSIYLQTSNGNGITVEKYFGSKSNDVDLVTFILDSVRL